MRKIDRPIVSTSLAATLTPTVSRGLLSLKIWTRNYIEVSVLGSSHQTISYRSSYETSSSPLKATYTGSSSSSEDQTTEVGSALVAQRSSGIDESADAVALQGRADESGAPGGDGVGGLLGLDELLLGVGELGAVVGLAEERAQHGELDAVVEEGAQRNGGGLNGREICISSLSAKPHLNSFPHRTHLPVSNVPTHPASMLYLIFRE